jgi:hypothetical protein
VRDPRVTYLTLKVKVLWDDDTWGGDWEEVAIDLSQRLFHGNEEHTPEAVEVLHTELLDAEEVQQ